MKRLFALALSLLLCLTLPVAAFAREYRGFSTIGNYSGSSAAFGFEPDATVMVYNNELYDEPDYEEIWPGADIYVPVYLLGAEDIAPATDKDIKNYTVSISWKSTASGRYIDDVTLVNGKKAKIDGLESDIYAKIEVNNAFTGNTAMLIQVDLVLSVNRVSYPETLTTLKFDLVNREVNIDRDTVYAAQSPTQFYAMRHYGGNATFDFGDKILYNATVKKATRYYLHLDRTEQEDIASRYPDAHLEFYNFQGTRDSFHAKGKLQIPIVRSKFTAKGESKAKVFVYQIDGDKLLALDEKTISFDSKKNILTINTKSLEQYVLSSQPLHKQIAQGEDDSVLYTGYATDDVSEPSGTAKTSGTSTRAVAAG
jgi:hypothetical protein